jgi:MSHA pilin protein MshC
MQVQRGFTLLELVAVLIVVSILSATTMTVITGLSQRDAADHAEQLRRDLAHLQVLALTWGVALRLTVSPSGGVAYNVTCITTATGTPCTTAGAVPVDPATGSSFSVALASGVTLTAVGGGTLDFDSLGRPVSSGVLITSTPPIRTYTFTGNSQTFSVTVAPVTGYAART